MTMPATYRVVWTPKQGQIALPVRQPPQQPEQRLILQTVQLNDTGTVAKEGQEKEATQTPFSCWTCWFQFQCLLTMLAVMILVALIIRLATRGPRWVSPHGTAGTTLDTTTTVGVILPGARVAIKPKFVVPCNNTYANPGLPPELQPEEYALKFTIRGGTASGLKISGRVDVPLTPKDDVDRIVLRADPHTLSAFRMALIEEPAAPRTGKRALDILSATPIPGTTFLVVCVRETLIEGKTYTLVVEYEYRSPTSGTAPILIGAEVGALKSHVFEETVAMPLHKLAWVAFQRNTSEHTITLDMVPMRALLAVLAFHASFVYADPRVHYNILFPDESDNEPTERTTTTVNRTSVEDNGNENTATTSQKLGLGLPCTNDGDCAADHGLLCVEWVCACKPQTPVRVDIRGIPRCVQARSLYEPCRFHQECSHTSDPMRCIDEVCLCPKPFEPTSAGLCQKPRPTLKTLIGDATPAAILFALTIVVVVVVLIIRFFPRSKEPDCEHPYQAPLRRLQEASAGPLSTAMQKLHRAHIDWGSPERTLPVRKIRMPQNPGARESQGGPTGAGTALPAPSRTFTMQALLKELPSAQAAFDKKPETQASLDASTPTTEPAGTADQVKKEVPTLSSKPEAAFALTAHQERPLCPFSTTTNKLPTEESTASKLSSRDALCQTSAASPKSSTVLGRRRSTRENDCGVQSGATVSALPSQDKTITKEDDIESERIADEVSSWPAPAHAKDDNGGSTKAGVRFFSQSIRYVPKAALSVLTEEDSMHTEDAPGEQIDSSEQFGEHNLSDAYDGPVKAPVLSSVPSGSEASGNSNDVSRRCNIPLPQTPEFEVVEGLDTQDFFTPTAVSTNFAATASLEQIRPVPSRRKRPEIDEAHRSSTDVPGAEIPTTSVSPQIVPRSTRPFRWVTPSMEQAPLQARAESEEPDIAESETLQGVHASATQADISLLCTGDTGNDISSDRKVSSPEQCHYLDAPEATHAEAMKAEALKPNVPPCISEVPEQQMPPVAMSRLPFAAERTPTPMKRSVKFHRTSSSVLQPVTQVCCNDGGHFSFPPPVPIKRGARSLVEKVTQVIVKSDNSRIIGRDSLDETKAKSVTSVDLKSKISVTSSEPIEHWAADDIARFGSPNSSPAESVKSGSSFKESTRTSLLTPESFKSEPVRTRPNLTRRRPFSEPLGWRQRRAVILELNAAVRDTRCCALAPSRSFLTEEIFASLARLSWSSLELMGPESRDTVRSLGLQQNLGDVWTATLARTDIHGGPDLSGGETIDAQEEAPSRIHEDELSEEFNKTALGPTANTEKQASVESCLESPMKPSPLPRTIKKILDLISCAHKSTSDAEEHESHASTTQVMPEEQPHLPFDDHVLVKLRSCSETSVPIRTNLDPVLTQPRCDKPKNQDSVRNDGVMAKRHDAGHGPSWKASVRKYRIAFGRISARVSQSASFAENSADASVRNASSTSLPNFPKKARSVTDELLLSLSPPASRQSTPDKQSAGAFVGRNQVSTEFLPSSSPAAGNEKPRIAAPPATISAAAQDGHGAQRAADPSRAQSGTVTCVGSGPFGVELFLPPSPEEPTHDQSELPKPDFMFAESGQSSSGMVPGYVENDIGAAEEPTHDQSELPKPDFMFAESGQSSSGVVPGYGENDIGGSGTVTSSHGNQSNHDLTTLPFSLVGTRSSDSS